MTPRRFDDESLVDIWTHLRGSLERGDAAEIVVPDPDRGAGSGVGARGRDAHGAFVQRPLRVWCDLAEGLGCRLTTPRPVAPGAVRLRFERLAPAPRSADPRERYAPGGAFARLDKLEDAATMLALLEAIGRCGLRPGERVLVLGVNDGVEIEALHRAPGAPALDELEVVGIDHGPAALAAARGRLASLPGGPAVRLLETDANALGASLGSERFDLAIAVGLLQSPGVDDRTLLRELVQARLRPGGRLIVGLPNSRLVDGDLLWGARTRNVGPVELGLLVKDAAWMRRYLHQHRFRVFASGKYDLLVTAVPAGATTPDGETPTR